MNVLLPTFTILAVAAAPLPAQGDLPDKTPSADAKSPNKKETPRERLFRLYAEKVGHGEFYTVKLHAEKVQSFNGGYATGDAVLSFRAAQDTDEKKVEAALKGEETEILATGEDQRILSLLTDRDFAMAFPATRTALQYDYASKARFTPWQYVLFRGLTPDLERTYKIEILRDPEDTKESGDTAKAGESDGGGGDAKTLETREGSHGTSGFVVDPFSLPFYILSLEPVDGAYKEHVSEFLVFVDPDTLQIRKIRYADKAEQLSIELGTYKFEQTIASDTFELNLDEYKVRKR